MAKNMLFLDPFKRFIASRRNHLENVYEWLTTAEHNQMCLVNKINSGPTRYRDDSSGYLVTADSK